MFLGNFSINKCIIIFAEKKSSNHRIPDAASVKAKMVYAGSKEALKKTLVGISVVINATDIL